MKINDFPLLKNRKIAYLDNAATSQKPKQVIDAIKDFYENHNANVHRGICRLSEDATDLYEKSRAATADFIGAAHCNTAFTYNATFAINSVALGLKISKDDNIVVSTLEHHSNYLPWQQLCKRRGAGLRVADIDEDGKVNMDHLSKLVDNKTKVIALSHVSNVLGTVADAKAASDLAHDKNALILLDAAQSVPHMNVNVKKLNCDFLAFSGHKMLGPMGIGVLYIRDPESIDPPFYGGGMVKDSESSTWRDPPARFEAGTPNVAGAVGLSAAIKYLKTVGMDNIESHEKTLLAFAVKRLPDIHLYGKPETGILSFNLKKIHAHDFATIADRFGVCIRAGHHCCQPLMKRLGISACARASFYLYNNEHDVEKLALAVDEAKKVFL